MRIISIIGATITGNRGAEAMLTTTIGRIRERFPECGFAVFSYYPQKDKELIDDDQIIVHNASPLYLALVIFPLSLILGCSKRMGLSCGSRMFPRSVADLSSSVVLIDIAGISFIDSALKFLPYKILSIFPAMILKVPVVKFSQAMGPFENPLNRLCAQTFLNRCQKIFARGERTVEFLKGIKLNKEIISSAPDVAFLQKEGDSITSENKEYVENIVDQLSKLKTSRRKIIGICPSSVVYAKAAKNGWDYAQFIFELCRKLIKAGHIVLIFPNATRGDDLKKLRNNDLPLIVKVAKEFQGVGPRELICVDKDVNTDSIKKLISLCDISVVSRFHAMIACLEKERPVMVLGWSHKYYEVMQQFGLEKWVIDYKDSDLDSIHEKLYALLQESGKVKSAIGQNIEHVKRASFSQFDYIFEMIGKNDTDR